MRVHILSDLHLEVAEFSDYVPPEDVDLVVLAGDIHVAAHGVEWAAKVYQVYKGNVPIVYVSGNHEFYSSLRYPVDISFNQMYEHIHATACRVRNETNVPIYVLERDAISFGDVEVFGATLWTDLDVHDSKDLMKEIGPMHMNDYRVIWWEPGVTLKPEHTAAVHAKTVNFFAKEIPFSKAKKKIVVTHHLPSEECCYPDYAPPRDGLNPFFASNLDWLVKNSKADLWVFGHTHSSHDFKIGKTRMKCNPRGYARSGKGNRYFDPGLVVEV